MIAQSKQYCGYEVIKSFKQISKQKNIYIIVKLVENQDKLNNFKNLNFINLGPEEIKL